MTYDTTHQCPKDGRAHRRNHRRHPGDERRRLTHQTPSHHREDIPMSLMMLRVPCGYFNLICARR